MKQIILSIMIGISLSACTSKHNFKVVNTEATKLPNSAMLKIKILVSPTADENEVRDALFEAYEDAKESTEINARSSSTKFFIYAYTSEQKITEIDMGWTAMLSKTPGRDAEVEFNSAQTKEDDMEMIVLFNTAKQVLESQGYDFCNVYYDFQKEIQRSNREDPQVTLADLERQEIKFNDYVAKYNLPDSIIDFIVIRGGGYCR